MIKRILLVSAFALLLVSIASIQAGDNEFEYVGAKKCKICHKPEFAKWEGMKHFKAFDNLPDDKKSDPNCIKCHTTGYGKKAAAKAVLNHVGCEACHGPGSEYKSVKIMSKKLYKSQPDVQHQMSLDNGMIIPNEQTCQGCHNQECEHSQPFDFNERWEIIKHGPES